MYHTFLGLLYQCRKEFFVGTGLARKILAHRRAAVYNKEKEGGIGMGIEYELKYRATPQIQQQIRETFGLPEQTFRMQTTYYDTPEADLSARWYTLRRRMENDVSVCTLKYPAGENGRGEIEVQCQEITQALPELCKLIDLPELPGLLEKGLVEVCGARFDRIAMTVSLQDTVVELALDVGVLTGGGKEVPLCEVEVELKSGSREQTAAFAQRLALAYGLEPEKRSKFRRAQALAKGE